MKATPADQKELLRLQALDTRAAQLTHRLANLPQQQTLVELGARVEDVRRRLVAARSDLDDVGVELRRLESDVATVEARMARDAERLQHTSSAKDAQALEAEVASLKKRTSDLEDIELAVMERLEEKQAAVDALEEEQAAIGFEVSAAEELRDRAVHETETEQAQVARDRDAVASGIPDDLVTLYEKRRALGGGVGAALLRARTCGGCTITLTGVDLEAVRTAAPDEIVYCPDCGRILVRTEESGI